MSIGDCCGGGTGWVMISEGCINELVVGRGVDVECVGRDKEVLGCDILVTVE